MASFSFGRIVEILIAFGGIYTAYITNAYIGEKMLNKTFASKPGKPDPIVFMVVFQSFLSYSVALFYNKFLTKARPNPIAIKDQFKMGGYTTASMVTSFKIMNYLSSPMMNLIKSSKSLSILLFGLIFGKASLDRFQVLTVALVTSGIIGFNVFQGNLADTNSRNTFLGYAIAFVSLIFDGFLASSQENARQYKPTSWEMMECTNVWNGFLSLVYGLISGELFPIFKIVMEDKEAFFDIGLMVFTGTVGQVFIFYTIKKFSPLFLSIVTSSRKFFTLGLSIIAFNHKVNLYQGFGIMLVVTGVVLEVYQKAKASPPTREEDKKMKV